MGQPESEEFPLIKYLDKLVDELRKLISRAIRGEDIDAVHDARVATRRLKAAVDLTDSVLSSRCKKPFAQVTRVLRRQLGPLRDLDVMLEHIGEINDLRFASATAWLKDRLTHCREKVVTDAGQAAPPGRMLAKLGTWWGVRHDIIEARKSIDRLLTESVHLELDEFSEQANQLVNMMANDVSAGEPRNDPHQVRIAGKSLRYTLEMARQHGLVLAPSVMSLFKRMQESLGLWHDYIVLTERMLCETVDCDLALHNPKLQGNILALAQATLRKAQANLKRMADLWKSRGEELSRQIRATFPLTKADSHDKSEAPSQETAAPAA